MFCCLSICGQPVAICEHERKEWKKEGSMEKWKCIVCPYVYDPTMGDPDNGIAPGTAFEDLPDDWVCPECGTARGMFQKLEE
jgi:rubredoxin